MTVFWRAMKSMMQDEAGVTAIEYALLASLIVIVAATSIDALGETVKLMWTRISDAVAGAVL